MAWVSEEQIRAAREMSAFEYLKRYQSGRLKKSSARNEYELTDHDSFKINALTSKWHWKSRDIGGTSALNFLVKVDGMSFTDAVLLLCDECPSYVPQRVTVSERKPFVLPDKNPTDARIRKYLSERGISEPVIRYCIELGILYESRQYHNAVFVGKDADGRVRYAFLRGIYESNGKSFKIEQSGSDKACAFCLPPKGESKRVAVYEACIDALAHMSIEQECNDKYRLALGGISAPKEGESRTSFKEPAALAYFLKNHPEVSEIEICTDNDHAGRYACASIRKFYENRYKVIEHLPQIEGADYADMAKAIKQEKRKQYIQQHKGGKRFER